MNYTSNKKSMNYKKICSRDGHGVRGTARATGRGRRWRRRRGSAGRRGAATASWRAATARGDDGDGEAETDGQPGGVGRRGRTN